MLAASARGEEPAPILVAGETEVAGVEGSPDCYAQFREGAVVVTNSGRLVVTAQGREKSDWSDRSGQDLVCRWSDDGGDSWEPAVLIAEMGDYTMSPNAAVYDRETDVIHVLCNVFEWDFHDPDSRKAMNGQECRQVHITSEDGGATWSEPRDITEALCSDR